MSPPISVVVVDDQALFREGLVSLLGTMKQVKFVGQAENGEQALRVVRSLQPQVVLMDLRMPVLDGVATTRRLRAEAPYSQVVVLTTFEDDESILEALQAGALGYILKDTSSEFLAQAIELAARGQAVLAPSVTTRVVQQLVRVPSVGNRRPTHPCLAKLSRREQQVLVLLGRGASNKDIAQALDVTEGTTKNHVSSILAKLGVSDRVQAALVARDMGLNF